MSHVNMVVDGFGGLVPQVKANGKRLFGLRIVIARIRQDHSKENQNQNLGDFFWLLRYHDNNVDARNVKRKRAKFLSVASAAGQPHDSQRLIPQTAIYGSLSQKTVKDVVVV